MSKLKHILEILPAYDKRNADPTKNYGIHGVTMRFLVKGQHGAVQFVLYTNWHLPHITLPPVGPMPADLGYHSPNPMYKGHHCIDNKCEYLDDKPCYYDGSGLAADEPFRILVERGGEALWQYLEKYYCKIFNCEADEFEN